MRHEWIGVLLLALGCSGSALAKPIQVENVQCEYLKDPIGIDATQPRLSWMLASDQRGQRQTAYQVVVASSPELLKQGQGDLWDSGKVASDQSAHVVYTGRPLGSYQRCFWKVRVRDKDGTASDWSSPVRGRWGFSIRASGGASGSATSKRRRQRPPTTGTSTMLLGLVSRSDPAKNAPAGKRYFRWAIDLPADAKVRTAGLVLTADDRFTLYVNGKPAGKSDEGNEGWRSPLVVDLSTLLGPGRNLIAIEAVNVAGPAGVVARCNVELQNGARINETSDASWAASQQSAAGWQNPAFDDSHWAKAKVLGPMGIGPWGHVLVAGHRGLGGAGAPSPMFRKVFEFKKPLARATASICGLGYYELHLNGGKVGDACWTRSSPATTSGRSTPPTT